MCKLNNFFNDLRGIENAQKIIVIGYDGGNNLDDLAAQNECSREEFNYKLASQIDFAMSTLNDLSVSVCNSLIVQTELGREIRNDLLKSYHKLATLKEGLI